MCQNKATEYVPSGYTYREIQIRCGSTSPSGGVALCEACAERNDREYPQGWRHVPGDTCQHGTYLGCHEDNDETLCGQCEAGA